MPVIDLIAALPQEIADHVLARAFGAARRGDGNEIGGGRQLRVEAGIDGIEDLLLGVGAHFDFLSPRKTCPYNSSQQEAAERRMADNKNVLYLIIGVLLVAVGVLGFNLYQAKKQPEGLQINTLALALLAFTGAARAEI
ncbi:hypothetical protein KXW38_010187, partial [Aspergillus fumigatus]